MRVGRERACPELLGVVSWAAGGWAGFVTAVDGNVDYLLGGGAGTFQCAQLSSGCSGADGYAYLSR